MSLFRRRASLWLSFLTLFTLVSCSGSISSTHPNKPIEVDATPPAGLSGAALLAWQVLHTPRPVRDPIALATQVRGTPGPIDSVVRTTPLNETVGTTHTFWVQSDGSAYKEITAKLVYLTAHAYVYDDTSVPSVLSDLRASTDLFENSMYIADRRYFGDEWQPGIDGDPRITILNSPSLASNVFGYFSSVDEYPVAVNQYSNQREIIYLHTGDEFLMPNTEGYNKMLAHEFQHMIHWHVQAGDPTWLNEGMAVLAQHINGFDAGADPNAPGLDDDFLADTNTQLDAWCDSTCVSPHYGAAYLFVNYFAEHYGGYPILKELLADPAQAPLNFNDILAEHGYKDRFDDVFAKWVMTNVLNDEPQGSDAMYVYKTVANKHATIQQTVTALPYSHDETTVQYAAQYYDFTQATGDQMLHFTFAGQATVPLISAVAPPAPATNLWWSNRGENLDTTLTHAFDLSKVGGQHVTLNFSLWYNLESDADYGYIEVSADGGQTWKPLPVQGTRQDDPNGLNLGNGLTGDSSADLQAWQSVSADLSGYAGKAIQVRFETVTDDTESLQGMAIANVAIPQIGFADNGASDNGWVTKGWLRNDNVLPETYIVQAAIFDENGKLTTVESMPVGNDGKGTLDIAHYGKTVRRVLVSVSAVAPATTLGTAYTLGATGG